MGEPLFVTALRACFDAVQAEAMAALERKDYVALHEALRREHDIIVEQGALINEQLVELQKRNERLQSAGPER